MVVRCPWGLPPAPQLATLACYPVEKDFVLRHQIKGIACRYIDDFWCCGTTPPPQENYSMEYKKTSENSQDVVYLGIRVQIRNNQVHSTIFDREEDYPSHIVRYPEFGSVAPRAQLAGVLTGRFVACLDACNFMQDFKESVGNVLRHAIWRHYPRRLVEATWSRFLFQRWQAGDIRKKELKGWFHKAWQYFINHNRASPNIRIAQEPVRPRENVNSTFLSIFGTPVESTRAEMEIDPGLTNTSQEGLALEVHTTRPTFTVVDVDSQPDNLFDETSEAQLANSGDCPPENKGVQNVSDSFGGLEPVSPSWAVRRLTTTLQPMIHASDHGEAGLCGAADGIHQGMTRSSCSSAEVSRDESQVGATLSVSWKE